MMKKKWLMVVTALLCACVTKPSLKPASFTAPESWKACVSVLDTKNKTSRLVFIDENGVISSVSSEIYLLDEYHPLPQTEESIWLVPSHEDKNVKPGKTLYELSRESTDVQVLTIEPAPFTAATENALYFAKTDAGSPAVTTLQKLDLETMEKKSLEMEGTMVRGLGASENGVCLLTVKRGTDLTAHFYDPDLGERNEILLLDDMVGNVFWCLCDRKMIVYVWHLDEEIPHKTMFIIEPDKDTYIKTELPFSKSGIPYSQDDTHVILVEAEERNDVLLTRYDINSDTYEEYIFTGTFRSLTADERYIYLLDLDGVIHVLEGKNPSHEINRFAIEIKDSEYCRLVFGRN